MVSLLLQSGFSGRAEIGLVGDDDLLIKVSADGSAWTEALRLKGSDGSARLKLEASNVAGLPSAAARGAGALIHVTDETGGAIVAFSDGTNWRRVSDRAIVS